jgi:hypothetical protein
MFSLIVRKTMLSILVAALGAAPVLAADFAEESYRIAEAQRLDAISRQLELNRWLTWRSGAYGDLWRYPSQPPIEHPIGYESRQVKPDRWIYRPVYASPAPRAIVMPALQPAAPVVQRPGPSELSPAPIDHVPGKARGVREF